MKTRGVDETYNMALSHLGVRHFACVACVVRGCGVMRRESKMCGRKRGTAFEWMFIKRSVRPDLRVESKQPR